MAKRRYLLQESTISRGNVEDVVRLARRNQSAQNAKTTMDLTMVVPR
jgi:hypothetical protein